MQLLFFQIRSLLIIQLHKVVDKVQVMPEIRNQHSVTTSACMYLGEALSCRGRLV
jgi:hypothetical protein